jgi:hypothetical protein
LDGNFGKEHQEQKDIFLPKKEYKSAYRFIRGFDRGRIVGEPFIKCDAPVFVVNVTALFCNGHPISSVLAKI